MNPTGHHRAARLRYLAAVIACAGLVTAAAAGPGSHSVPRATAGGTPASATPVQTIHLVAHETQREFLNERGLGDEEIFRGTLDNAAGTTKAGIFAGTLTSVSPHDSLNLATVDLQLPGGQVTVPGFLPGTQPPIVHAITGGTSNYTGVTQGTLTVYDGTDPACTPHQYGPGTGFFDPGFGHVHIARNEGSTPVTVVQTYLNVPPGGSPRIDAPAPGNCPF